MRLLVLSSLLVVFARPAFAVNPESTMLSADSSLGGAVLAADDEGGGGWYNPASLGGIKRNSLRLGVSAYSVAWVNVIGSLVTTSPWSTQSQDTHDSHFTTVPSVLGLTWKVTDRVGLSLGLWTPFHTTFSSGFDTTDSGPLPSAPSLTGTLAQRYDWTQLADDTWGALAVGWAVHPRLRVGAALQGAYSTSERTVHLNVLLQTNSTVPGEQGAHLSLRTSEATDVLALRGVLGVQWMPLDSLRLAVVVNTPRVRIYQSRSRVQVLLVGVLLPGYGNQEGGLIDTEPAQATLAVLEPTRVAGGAQWQVGRLSLRFDAEWSPAHDDPLAPRLKPSTHLKLGALFTWSENLTIGLGSSYRSPRMYAADGALSVDQFGISGGVTSRSSDVIRALGGGDKWDLLTTIAVNGTYGVGKGPGLSVVPLDLSQSALPVLLGEPSRSFLEVPASTVDLSVHFMSTLKF